MSETDVLRMFAEAGYQISPDAAELIASHNLQDELVNYVLKNIDDSVLVVDVDDIDIDGFLSHDGNGSDGATISIETKKPAELNQDCLPVSPVSPSSSSAAYAAPIQSSFSSTVPKKAVNPVKIISDITNQSTCVGEYMEFVQYFRDRYSKLSEMIRGRINARPIESLTKNRRLGDGGNSDEVSVIGMISDLRTTTNGHRLIEIEDNTSSLSVLVRTADKELFEQANSFVLDEVVGVTGVLTNDKRLLIASKFTMPDLPNTNLTNRGSHGKAVFISDVHVGSSTFLEDEWLRFIDFLNGNIDDKRMQEISEDIRYLVVSGDLVDGIGVYPGQEKELSITDVYDQYRKAAEYFKQIPENITVIIGPGNHDAVRQAEPQPCFGEYIKSCFPDNVTFVGNPALIDLDGVKVLMYHGRSIDDFVASVPHVSYQKPTTAMVEMMKFRHLSPIYGGRISIAPEKHDHFVIDQIPDILHCGHVHTVGVQPYKNVLLINSGTWQSQTEFQKRVNLVPTPARVPVVDLSNLKTSILKFN
ncbi:MAG: DNA-directed DNA polymerase II small subunit [Methanohalobium sp.]|uniref:DNA-directed DNA polymerase II small subunit n=1 Tax=Methanohalobium sp. TaxID=2837493 RepID=UPI003978B96C